MYGRGNPHYKASARWRGQGVGAKSSDFRTPKHPGNLGAWGRLKEQYEAASNENYERTLSRAINSLVASKTAVKSFQEALALKGVGKHCARIICPLRDEGSATVVSRPSGKQKQKSSAEERKLPVFAGKGPPPKEIKYQRAKRSAIDKWSHPVSESRTSAAEGLLWKVLLVVDVREPKHEHIVSKCSMSGIPAESRHLPIGDMLWIAQGLRIHRVCGETTLTVEAELLLGTIIERKTTDDLVSSLFGTRYMEQRLRLKHSGQPQVLFLIEGDIQKDVHPKFPKERLQMALLETREMGFHIIFADHMDATVQTLKRFHRRILQRTFPEAFGVSDDALPFFSSPSASCNRRVPQIQRGPATSPNHRRRVRRPTSLVEMVLDTPPVPAFGESRFMTYAELKCKIDRDREAGTKTAGAIHRAMLRQVCGNEKVKAIRQHFPTLSTLLQAYDSNEGNQKHQSLLVANCIDANKVDIDVNRKVGPNTSQELYFAYCTASLPKSRRCSSRANSSPPLDERKPRTDMEKDSLAPKPVAKRYKTTLEKENDRRTTSTRSYSGPPEPTSAIVVSSSTLASTATANPMKTASCFTIQSSSDENNSNFSTLAHSGRQRKRDKHGKRVAACRLVAGSSDESKESLSTSYESTQCKENTEGRSDVLSYTLDTAGATAGGAIEID